MAFAGWSDRDVNAFLLQPFLNYNLPHGWYLTSVPIMTADFSASSGNHWTVPVGAGEASCGVSAGSAFPSTPGAAFYNAVRPELGAEWQLRFQLQFLFPR